MCTFNTLVNYKSVFCFGRVASCSYCDPLVSNGMAMYKDPRVTQAFKFEAPKRVPFVFNISSRSSNKRGLELITMIL